MVFRKTILQIYFRAKNQWKSPAVLFNISVNVSAMTRDRGIP